MPRSTNAPARKQRRKKILKEAKGYFGHKSIGYKSAKEQVTRTNLHFHRTV